ncbi:ArsR/SmtB family transcription factor [Mucilaginibacter aquaedulcis]|jgi:DNA-binding transcriptional ArsR family regulator|uniref:ArsR/SmtB family transcription factor n=1 Tax=Mucilaginibacter aquaedulcis TaxID=1187081 RepID=UPI0025B4EF9F|nr:metalloregulator ArsR/SmtB family transcription factor [Mucilaginibacter aquaedulcis]MDN3550538.1 metalloregulator ArsR/SmtB family transcription factor [Mucilaginibacter aquaedulcis]
MITTRRDVFQAIADPTRRQIINLIAHQPLNLNAIADNFDVSRPAISQHIKILIECGLIDVKKNGRERYCEAKLGQLNEVAQWIEQYRKSWDERFDKMDDLLARLQKENKNTDEQQ